MGHEQASETGGPVLSDRFVDLVNATATVDLRLSDFHPRSALKTPATQIEQPRFPVIDYHNHLDSTDPAEVLAIMDETGVEKVVNNIEVLPLSPMDDRIRRASYRAIYGNTVLNQYALRAVPPIHIIVNHGHVTLVGVVARQMDKQVAEMQAKSVSGVFSVTDNLQVENQ